MAGSLIEVNVDSFQVQTRIDTIIGRIGNAQPAMAIIGETVTASVKRNFEVGGRPNGWQELSDVTLAMKGGRGRILMDQGGWASGLAGSIHYEADANSVMIGTNKIYAATHQFGREGGGWWGSDIPARPFLMVQDEDWQEIEEALEDYIFSGV